MKLDLLLLCEARCNKEYEQRLVVLEFENNVSE
jgi:hypothetical protein